MISLKNYKLKEMNDLISLELERARIPVIYDEETDTAVGQLFGVNFIRGGFYWIADGFVSLKIAEEIYLDPVGRTDIRIGGHVMGLAPTEYGMWGVDKEGYMTHTKDSKDAVDFVSYNGYQIDSEVGLRVFADILYKYESIIADLNK